MWVFVGGGEKLEPVIGGRQLTKHCDKCGQTTVFYEKKISQTFRLYFVHLFAYAPKQVMACGACGAYFATGDKPPSFAEAQTGTVAGAVGQAARRAKEAFEDGTVEAQVNEAQERAKAAFDDAKSAVEGWWKKR